MILTMILSAITAFFTALYSGVGVVTELPFGIDTILVQGVGYLRFMISIFPPLQVLFNAVLFVISFKLSLKLFAMIPLLRRMLYK